MNNSRSKLRILGYTLIFFLAVLVTIAGFARLMQVSNIELQYTNSETMTDILSIKGNESEVTISLASDTSSDELDYWDYLHFSMVSYFTIGYGDIIILPTSGKKILWLEMFISLVLNAFFTALLVMELMKPKDKVVIYHSIFLQKEDNHITVPIKNYGKTLVDAQFKLEFGVANPNNDETNYLKSISDSKPFFNKRKQLSIKKDKDKHSKEFDAFVEQLVGLKKGDKFNIRVFLSGMCINTGSKLAKSETFTIQKKDNGEFDNVFACEKLHILAKKHFILFGIKYKISDFQNVKVPIGTDVDKETIYKNIKKEKEEEKKKSKNIFKSIFKNEVKDEYKINNNMTKEKFIEKFFDS